MPPRALSKGRRLFTQITSPSVRPQPGPRRCPVGRAVALLLVALLATVPGALAQTAPARAPETPAAPSPAGEFRIGAGDVLQLFVWKEPELSREVTVRLDGKVTVPLLGDVAAAGRTTRQLAGELQSLLGRYLEAPQVTLELKQANSSRIYVLGMVANPGVYPLNQPTTVVQGLAFAGGFKEFARTEDILIIREGETGAVTIPVNFKKIEAGRDLAQNVTLRAGDTIVVP